MKKILLSIALVAAAVPAIAQDETVYFNDDFEWLATETNILTYTNASGQLCTDNVGGNMKSGAYNPQSTTIKNPDGETVWDLLLKKGYNMESTSETQAKKSIGLAKCYIKMSVTTYTAALTLPAMPTLGDGKENVVLQFDWTPMTDGGKGVWDDVEVAVVVKTGSETKTFKVEKVAKTNGLNEEGTLLDPYKWTTVKLPLDGITVNKDTRITLRNADPNFPETATTGAKMRWFVDNIKVYSTSGAGVGEIVVDENAPVEYYNLQGAKVANPENGVFIRRQGSKASKVIL